MQATKTAALGGSLGRGAAWNLASFVVMGVAGLAINLLIARYYEPWTLGVFNFVLAVFIFGGQLGAFAIQYSVLYHTPRALVRSQPTSVVLSTALGMSAPLSAVVAAAGWSASGWLAGVFNSPEAAEGLAWSSFGLFLFPLNKILLAHLNGKREMRAYAMGNAGRAILVVTCIVAFIATDTAGQYVPVSLAIAELVLFACLLAANRADLQWIEKAQWPRWRRRHLTFGSRGVLGGILFELNTRIDVFALAFLANMDAVGIYSMASTFAEGLFQLLIVLRFSFDPVIARLAAQTRWDELRDVFRRGRRLAYAGMLVVGVAAIAAYPFVIDLLTRRDEYDASWHVFTALAIGIMLAAGYIPFSGLLQQSGHPGMQSLLISAVMLTNLVGNVLLIPRYGALGAAVATAISQVLYVPYLIVLVRYKTSFRF